MTVTRAGDAFVGRSGHILLCVRDEAPDGSDPYLLFLNMVTCITFELANWTLSAWVRSGQWHAL